MQEDHIDRKIARQRPISVLLLMLFTAASLLAQGQQQGQQKFKVLATASMWADMTEVIAGHLVEVDMIVPRGNDPHMYEPTPEDVIKVKQADLILRNGLTFEGWLDKLINNAQTQAAIVTLTDDITPITSTTYKNAPDPHAWMTASNGKVYVDHIINGLTQLMPDKADEIIFNGRAYQQELQVLHDEMVAKMATIPEAKRVLITSHDAFQYFGRAYGLRLESVLGTSTDAQVRASDITHLSKVLRTSSVPAVFIETTVNPKQLQQLARDHGVRIGGKLYADALGPIGSPGGTYKGMLMHNAQVIHDALTSEPQETIQDPGVTETDQIQNVPYPVFLYVLIALVALLIGVGLWRYMKR